VSRTFSFKALRNPLVSTILTKESFGYKDAETSDGTRVKVDIDKRGSRILIIEWRVLLCLWVPIKCQESPMKSSDVATVLRFSCTGA
jgi:hypothetical protein